MESLVSYALSENIATLTMDDGKANVMSLRMLLEVGILGILPVFLVWRLPVRYAPPMRQLIHNALWIVGGLAVVVASVAPARKDSSPSYGV